MEFDLEGEAEMILEIISVAGIIIIGAALVGGGIWLLIKF